MLLLKLKNVQIFFGFLYFNKNRAINISTILRIHSDIHFALRSESYYILNAENMTGIFQEHGYGRSKATKLDVPGMYIIYKFLTHLNVFPEHVTAYKNIFPEYINFLAGFKTQFDFF